ncbi:conserved hypothetical protein [Pyrobaculum arsenaticum DSM 13514]|uniref:Uncharacterized protein n=1 Tax=Pyrobaculum arsenaticum (strain DSM 13514 / JCM 11321 / PZ6) TaxID=340102 RepID=A4WI02_PYRAR|nr:conserved hypothetical protein [Pyrobaculum arsenaticum DSM 13514]
MISDFIADLDIKENINIYYNVEFAKIVKFDSSYVYTYIDLNLYLVFNVAGVVNMVAAVWHGVALWVYAVVVAPLIYHISLTYKGI